MTIPTAIAEVLAGGRPWACECMDNLALASELPDQCVDLVMGSPPYEAQRTYGIGFNLKGQEWVDWMVRQWQQWQRISRGPVVMVVEGFTKDFRYSATPFLLVADLHRAGFTLRKPPIYYRFGISGSGGADWFRNDYEYVICTTPGGKLAWSDNTACGHPPKWAPGGEMGHRLTNGTRVNQWGGHKRSNQTRRVDGSKQPPGRPSHVVVQGGDLPGDGLFGEPARKRCTKTAPTSSKDGDFKHREYTPPILANPGNVVRDNLTQQELARLLEVYVHASGTHPDALLRDMRQAVIAQAIPEWFAGIVARIFQASLLQPRLQGSSPAPAERPALGRTAAPRAENCEEDETPQGVRELRPDKPVGGSPPGRRRDTQHASQPGGSLLVVPPEGAQARGLPGAGLSSALCGSGLLQQALPAVQEVWRSAHAFLRTVQAPGESSALVHCKVGGNLMGNPKAYLNEAPFGETLAERFIRSFCPPGGLVFDPFAGSGTTLAVAIRWRRRAIGTDVRESQVDLTRRRCGEETPMLEGMV